MREVNACGWDHFVLFTSTETGDQHVLPFLKSLPPNRRLIHYELPDKFDNSEELKRFLWDAYSQKQSRNFIFVSVDPSVILASAQRVFDEKQRDVGALMAHDARFLIVLNSNQIISLRESVQNTTLDNIAVFVLEESMFNIAVKDVFTLMWRQHRRRELEKLNMEGEVQIPATCRIFPNTKFGLNGRTILILAKEWLSHLYTVTDPTSGRLSYTGLYVQVIEVLAEMLNFTVQFTPDPGLDKNLTWERFTDSVGGSEVDMGATTYMTSSQIYYNHTVSFPLISSNISAVYMNSARPEISSPLKLFQVSVYASLLLALVFTMMLYLLILWVSPEVKERSNNMPIRRSKYRHQMPSKELHSVSTQTVFTELSTICPEQTTGKDFTNIKTNVHTRGVVCTSDKASSQTSYVSEKNETNDTSKFTEGSIKQTRKSLKTSKQSLAMCRNGNSIELLVALFFTFVGSIFTQDSLPTPSDQSARILLFSWCLMLLILTATFTGNITADLVDQGKVIPFSTLEELIARGDYKWGLFNESSFLNVMKNAKNGSLLKVLYDKMEQFALTDPSVIGTIEDQIRKLNTERYVTFFFSSDREYLNEFLTDPSSLVFLKDYIMTIYLGFNFPKKSKLAKVVSEKMMLMSDMGLLECLVRKNLKSQSSNATSTDADLSLKVEYMGGLFYCCGIGVLISVAVLLLECVYSKMCQVILRQTERRGSIKTEP
ncbi:uncharacterized protein LOC131937501 [Physella acuta]|uniref:uncharacterized protein LOC131937501 n=1 Tax=Physella acuta TaxID=109671 RepID=UPI0027DE3E58|nr:uncharacterized protein LOC131937501 [Physella acuta]